MKDLYFGNLFHDEAVKAIKNAFHAQALPEWNIMNLDVEKTINDFEDDVIEALHGKIEEVIVKKLSPMIEDGYQTGRFTK